MRRLGIWKVLVPPAAVPLALSLFVALAGPGGVIEVSDDTGGPSAATEVSGGGTDGVDDGTEGVGDVGEAGCFLTVLSDGAHSYMVLQEHVSDAEMPQGGVAGNQNALDKICLGAVDGSEANIGLVPGKSGDAPGKSGDAPGKSGDAPGKNKDATTSSTDLTGTGPGKSEQAPGEPTAGGQAQGEGQTNADEKGNGPAQAQGQNKPSNDNKP